MKIEVALIPAEHVTRQGFSPPPAGTAALAACLAWGTLSVAGAVDSWPQTLPRVSALIDAWAAADDWSWPTFGAQMARLAMVVPLAVGALILVLGTGATVSSAISKRPFPLGLALPLGFGMLSLVLAGLGLAGLFHPALLKLIALYLLLLGILKAPLYRGTLSRFRRGFVDLPIAVAAPLFFVGIGWIFLATLPDGSDDALIYQWSAPEQFLLQHRLVGAEWHVHWQGPLGVNILYTLAIAIGGILGIKCMHLTMVWTLLIALATLARRLGAAPWTVVVLFALSPAVAEQVWWSMNDVGGMMFWTVTLAAPLLIPLNLVPGAVVTGILAGSLLSVKYTSLFPFAGLVAWVLLHRPPAKRLLLLAFTAAATSSAWFIRTWFVTGNPVFPFATWWFEGIWWGPQFERAFHSYAAQVSPTPPLSPSGFLLTCRNLLASPLEFGPIIGVCPDFLDPAKLTVTLLPPPVSDPPRPAPLS